MEEETIQKNKQPKQELASIVRIMQTDIPGNKNIITGLTYIKGISWTLSNALCKILVIDPSKKITELEPKEVEALTNLLKNPDKLPNFILNRRNDFETGEDGHLVTSGLDMKKEFDIRRLKKIRSYRGLRHAFGHPARGQRTRSHFRSKGKAVGVQKKAGAKKK